MPFHPRFDDIFEKLIRSALPDYQVVRADSHLNQQNILRSIAEGIHAADLVIADVSGPSANVMYELGAAHALGKPTVMISQSLSDLPFDLRSYPVQIYAPTGEGSMAFAERLRQIGEKHALGQLRFGNPMTDFLPVPAQAIDDNSAGDVRQSDPTAESGYGYLDYSADMEEYGEKVADGFARMTGLSSQLVTDIRSLAPAIQQARSAGSAKNEKRLMTQLAEFLNDYANTLKEVVLPSFHEGWERVGHAMFWMASQTPTDTDLTQIEHLCTSNQELREVLRGTINNVAGVRETVITGRGRTGVLDRAIDSLEQAFNGIVSEVMIADAMLKAVYDRVGCSEVG